MTHDQHLIAPTQIRSRRSAVQSLQEDMTIEIRLRTRGPIRRAPGINGATTLDGLVSSLRRENGGLPLVAVVFARRLLEQSAAIRFVGALRSSLDIRFDVVWAVELEPAGEDVNRVVGPSVVLNASDLRDLFILRNLVADILFFPAEDVRECELLKNFESRAPFVILPRGATLQEDLTEMAAAIDLGTALIHPDLSAVLSPADIAFAPADGESLRAVGDLLRRRAARLTVRHDRRSILRLDLLELRKRYQNWDREIVAVADASRWPAWAVQMLPERYVKLTEEDDGVHAYAWSTLANCFAPHVRIVRKLCDGEMLEIASPPDVIAHIEKLSARIEAKIGGAANAERSFFGAVADAISDTLEEELPHREWSVTMKQLTDQLGAL